MDRIKNLFNHSKKTSETEIFKWKKVAFKKNDVSSLNSLLNRLLRKQCSGKQYARNYGFSFYAKSDGHDIDRKQRVVVKVSFGHSKKIHENFINIYMQQKNKSNVEEKPVLFGSDEYEYKSHLSASHFKIIISPENQDVDLYVLTSGFIKRLEILTGYEFYWEGAIHKDTGHKHVHLAINGLDKHNHQVYFSSEIIKEIMRTILCEEATLLCGERKQDEILNQKMKVYSAARWTKLDEILKFYSGSFHTALLPVKLLKRLDFLASISLAEKKDNVYLLKNDWENKLKQFGRYNSFMNEYLKVNGKLELYSGGFISGMVEKIITFDKDESWNDAVIVRTKNNSIYVPVFNLHKTNILGKMVKIDLPENKAMYKISDRDIIVLNETMKKDIER